MRMTNGSKRNATLVVLAVAVIALTFAIAPLTVAASSGSEYPMEVIRVHTVYQSADPAAASVGIGVFGNE